MTIPMTIVDTIFRALAPALPDRVAAGHHADLCVGTIHGINPRTGRFFVGSRNPPGGGWGATAGSDGMSAVVCINDGDTHNAVIEALEAKYPVVVERYALGQTRAARANGGAVWAWNCGCAHRRRCEPTCTSSARNALHGLWPAPVMRSPIAFTSNEPGKHRSPTGTEDSTMR